MNVLFSDQDSKLLTLSLIVQRNGQCLSYGKMFKKLVPDISKKGSFDDYFNLLYPSGFEELFSSKGGAIKISVKGSLIKMRGEVQRLENQSILIMLCPIIDSSFQFLDLGLNLNEVPGFLPLQQLIFMKEAALIGETESSALVESLLAERSNLADQNKLLDFALTSADMYVVRLNSKFKKVYIYAPGISKTSFGLECNQELPIQVFTSRLKSSFHKPINDFFELIKIEPNQHQSLDIELFNDQLETEWWQLNLFNSNYNSEFSGIGILINIDKHKLREQENYRSEEMSRRLFSIQVHDKLCQKLFASRVILDTPHVEEAKPILDELIYTSRAIMNVLDINFFEQKSPKKAFEKYTKSISKIYNEKIEFSWLGPSIIEPFDIAFCIFRIYQEIIFCVTRYNHGPINISIQNDDFFLLKITCQKAENEDFLPISKINIKERIPYLNSELNVKLREDSTREIKLYIDIKRRSIK